MGDNNQTIGQEIYQFFAKGLVWVLYISIGVIAKLAFDSRTNKLTKKEIIVKSILSIFCGYLAAVLCEALHYNNWAKVVVPVSTLLGEGLVMYLMTNWKTLLSKVIPGYVQKEKK